MAVGSQDDIIPLELWYSAAQASEVKRAFLQQRRKAFLCDGKLGFL